MRRDPRTGRIFLEPGDPQYNPNLPDGGYIASTGYGAGFQGFDPGPQQIGGSVMAQYQEPPQLQDDFEFGQINPSTDIAVDDADLMQGFAGEVGDSFIAQYQEPPDPLQQERDAYQRMLKNREAIRLGQTPEGMVGRVVAGVPVDENFIKNLQQTAGQQRAAQPGSITGEDLAPRAPIEGQGPQPISLEGTPTASPAVGQTESRSLAATPERQAEAASDPADPRPKQLGTQLIAPSIIGALQVALPIIQRVTDPTIKEAERTRDQFVEGQAGEETYRETMTAGRAAINRQAQLSRQVQEDIAAASGATDVRRQEQIRDAAADAFTKEEAELEANARELAARADAESLGEFRSAIAYLSQANNAVAQSVMQALGQFAPVVAALDVNQGYKEYSKSIQNLPPEFQDMFYAYSMNAKSTDELARLYAYVKQRAAAAETAQASATQDTAQNTEA